MRSFFIAHSFTEGPKRDSMDQIVERFCDRRLVDNLTPESKLIPGAPQ